MYTQQHNAIQYNENLIYHFPTCYAYFYRGTKPKESFNWMKIQESFFLLFLSFIFFSTGSDSCFCHPSSVILGVFVFFFILIFCESLAMQCNAMQCNAMQCNAMQCNAIQYNTIQYNTMQYNAIQYNTIQYNTIQYNAIQCNTMQYNAIQYVQYTIQYNAIQYNTMQCNTIQSL